MPHPGWRILVVEPEMAHRFALRRLFREHGWDVRVAGRVEEALGQVDARPDWILVDPDLPDGDGRDVLRAARALGLSPRVVIVSRHLDAYARLDEFDPDVVMDKPIAFDRLINAACGHTARTPSPRTQFQSIDDVGFSPP